MGLRISLLFGKHFVEFCVSFPCNPLFTLVLSLVLRLVSGMGEMHSPHSAKDTGDLITPVRLCNLDLWLVRLGGNFRANHAESTVHSEWFKPGSCIEAFRQVTWLMLSFGEAMLGVLFYARGGLMVRHNGVGDGFDSKHYQLYSDFMQFYMLPKAMNVQRL